MVSIETHTRQRLDKIFPIHQIVDEAHKRITVGILSEKNTLGVRTVVNN